MLFDFLSTSFLFSYYNTSHSILSIRVKRLIDQAKILILK